LYKKKNYEKNNILITKILKEKKVEIYILFFYF